jgi:ribosomal protein L37AE/L43A
MNATVDSGASAGTVQRAVPYCCPFCGEEDLRPLESGAASGLTRGGWHCRSCLRVFSISFHGVHQPVLPDSHPLSTVDRPPLESDRS